MKVPRLDHGHHLLFIWPEENDFRDLLGQEYFKFLDLHINVPNGI